MASHVKSGIVKYTLMMVMLLALPIGITTYCSPGEEAESMTFSSGITIYTDTGVMDGEQYLIGMIAAQIEPGVPQEMLKTQAVIARTMLYNQLGGRSSGEAQFLGLAALAPEETKQRWGAEYATILQAVRDTAGKVVVYEGQPIVPAFFALSGGMTRSAAEAWGKDIPYLASVDSASDLNAPEYTRSLNFSKRQVIALLKRAYPAFNAEEDTLSSTFQIQERDSAGYVSKLQIGNKILTGEAFRYALNLPSACFDGTFTQKEIMITTKGIGHGVGLSQYGGSVMANDGSTYESILSYYFPGTTIEKIW